jgi:hypothetical protein
MGTYNGTSPPTESYLSLITPVPTSQMYAVCGFGNRIVTVGVGGAWYSNDPFNGQYYAMSTALGTTSANGCWMSDENTVWVVGNSPSGMPGYLAKCTLQGGPSASCQTQTPGGSIGPLTAISGWKDPLTNKLELWAVGYIGGQVLRSDGMGSWMNVQTPNNQAMLGVWVSPIDGEVVAGGYQGEINHFY